MIGDVLTSGNRRWGETPGTIDLIWGARLSDGQSRHQRDRFLDPEETAPLLEALGDQSVEVRIAAFEALTRLPLAPSDWIRVADFVARVLEANWPVGERQAVIDASPWIPVRQVPEMQDDPLGRPIPPTYEWARHTSQQAAPPKEGLSLGPAPGFIMLWPEELAQLKATLATRGHREPLGPGADPQQVREEAAAITLEIQEALPDSLEHRRDNEPGAANDIVRRVAASQGYFQPDLVGLFSAYRWVARMLFAQYQREPAHQFGMHPPAVYGTGPGSLFRFVQVVDLGGPRSLCYQIGWTVSRGGLRGLVPRLAAPLASADMDDRMAAAYLIADAADYVREDWPPVFGGGSGPDRGPVAGWPVKDLPWLARDAPVGSGEGPQSLAADGDAGEGPPVARNGGDEGSPVAANGGDSEGHRVAGNGGGGASQPARRRRRAVGTGFARPGSPSDGLPRERPLAPGAEYFFWLTVGEPEPMSIEEEHRELLPRQTLQAGSRFLVAVFPFPGELEIDERARLGELEIDADGRFSVVRQPGEAADEPRPHLPRSNARGQPMLLFPVRTPSTRRPHRLRCSIYFRNSLVQSRVVTAHVGKAPDRGPALSATVDFSLAQLDGADLAPVQPHSVSILINDNGDSTHSFRILGAPDGPATETFANNSVLRANALQDLIEDARASMREVAWGSTEPWTEDDKNRYAADPPPDLATDLIELMRQGRDLYDALINELAGGADAATALRKLMLPTARVQIVSKGSPSELVPASLFYDYDNVKPQLGGLRLCPQFETDRRAPDPLEVAICFRGDCPSRLEPQVVCPSGFWGFRHALGMPVARNVMVPVPAELPVRGQIGLGLAVYPGLDLWDEHRIDLEKKLRPLWSLKVVDTFQATLDLLRERRDVIYFYCHGGWTLEEKAYLLVGPEDGPKLVRRDLRWDDDDRWRFPRSLVILNGCETTALEPDRAIDLVSAFLENIGAAGVIGTEITIFEELATRFGASLLEQLGRGAEVGEAVRRSRLALLKEGNPLGLVYLPMVQSDARFVSVS